MRIEISGCRFIFSVAKLICFHLFRVIYLDRICISDRYSLGLLSVRAAHLLGSLHSGAEGVVDRTVRSDWTALVKQFQAQLYGMVF